jgi:hypothetical protein
MKILSWHRKPLKNVSPLIWVTEFEFVTSLNLDQCRAKLESLLSLEQSYDMTIHEINIRNETITFAACKVLRFSKVSVAVDLIGVAEFNKHRNQTLIQCLVGEPLMTTALSLLIFALLVVGFNVFYFPPTFSIIGILAFISFGSSLIEAGYSLEIRKAIKTEIMRLLIL